ncbi:MAG: hypothetical protein MHMPM18_002425 [Marteilia pararefringens]
MSPEPLQEVRNRVVSHCSISNLDEVSQQHSISSSKFACSPSISQSLLHKHPKILRPKIILLDGKELQLEVTRRDPARVLLAKICKYLHIRETIYFGLYFRDTSNRKIWLNLSKSLGKQIKNPDSRNWIFVFRLKFYPPAVTLIVDDITLYYITLQLRNDILSQKLAPSFNILATMCAYVVQSEVGDYRSELHGNCTSYISAFNFVKNQTPALLEKIALAHRSLSGIEASESDRQLIDLATRLNQYGHHCQVAIDSLNSENLTIAVNPTGLSVMRQNLVLHHFAWQQITKIKSERRLFIIQAFAAVPTPNYQKKSKINRNAKHETVSSFSYRMKDEKTNDAFLSLVIEHHIFFRMRNGGVGEAQHHHLSNENRASMIVENVDYEQNKENLSATKSSSATCNADVRTSFRFSSRGGSRASFQDYSLQNSDCGSSFTAGLDARGSHVEVLGQNLAHSSALYDCDEFCEAKILPIIVEDSVIRGEQKAYTRRHSNDDDSYSGQLLIATKMGNKQTVKETVSNLRVETHPASNSNNSSPLIGSGEKLNLANVDKGLNNSLDIPIYMQEAALDNKASLQSIDDPEILSRIEKNIENFKLAEEKVAKVTQVDADSATIDN